MLLCDGLPPHSRCAGLVDGPPTDLTGPPSHAAPYSHSSLLINVPELAPYRDIAFLWKWFLNPDRSAFPNAISGKATNVARRSRMGAQLVWQWSGSEGGYEVKVRRTIS
jgi:hypothetical protein